MNQDMVLLRRQELNKQIDNKTRQNYQAFFKEHVTAYGVKTATVSSIAKKYFQYVKQLGKKAIFLIFEELLKSDYNEEAFIAFKWAHWMQNECKPGD